MQITKRSSGEKPQLPLKRVNSVKLCEIPIITNDAMPEDSFALVSKVGETYDMCICRDGEFIKQTIPSQVVDVRRKS